MISSTNDYSVLKWPLIIISFSITLLALLILLSFNSHNWYSYESIRIRSKTIIFNKTMQYSDILEYGSFGLWFICIHQGDSPTHHCDTWTYETRPQYFNIIIILSTCTLYLANLAIFPSWALLILILYNINNRYLQYMNAFIWTILVLSLLITCILGAILIINAYTKFYSPGKFFIETTYISFHSDRGISYMVAATILASLCFLLILITFVWKTFLEMKMIESEGALLKQLSDEHFQPGWHKPIMIPRSATWLDDNYEEPPPYNYFDDENK
ncbi:unnamed protein product [Rotaria sordida]|uniref:Uncharacterized protein n=1 Tax=Rotaria sordida TaxID=392033 RepID=A0A815DFY7_9BILA|nr:unnamed protein product [Rotaria sordida]CAF1297322.1 unnamed protein product [Rotaria sordida]